MDKLLKNLNLTTSHVSLLSTFILVLSILHDYIFITAFDISFAELPTTLSDHLRSSLIWIPLVIFLIGISYFISTWRLLSVNGISEEAYIKKFKRPILGFSLYNMDIIIFTVGIIIMQRYYLKEEVNPLFSIIMPGLCINYLIYKFIIKNKYNEIVSKIIFSLLSTIILVIGLGRISVYSVKHGFSKEYTFQLEDNTTYQGILARSYEKVYMIWDKEKEKIQFIQSDKVVSFSPTDTNTTVNHVENAVSAHP